MQTNQDDLYKLATCLTELIALNPSGGSEDLRLRLGAFKSCVLRRNLGHKTYPVTSRNLEALAAQCQSIAEKSRSKQFFNSRNYKEAIQLIRKSIASHIQDFTVRMLCCSLCFSEPPVDSSTIIFPSQKQSRIWQPKVFSGQAWLPMDTLNILS